VPSFNDALGLVAAADGTVTLDTRPEHQVAPEVIHFAVLATLGEVAAARAVGAPVVPAAVALSLLTRARPGRLVGRGTLLRRGRSLAVAEGEVHQGDVLVAKVTVTFAVLG
jgi:acyl-coenzyme A thioesterase PaaI-like protein